MSNMSYCMFQNTLADLQDCEEKLQDIEYNLAELSKEEARAASRLLKLCYRMCDGLDGLED